MEAESNFRCPVCRAGQPLQNECRRCQADLSLVVLAHRRVDHLRALLNRQAELSIRERELVQHELTVLSPGNLPR